MIVVAMSGGVDSSTVAAMLHELGHHVVGITLQLYDHSTSSSNRKSGCCAGQDVYDAKSVASKIGIAHYVLNYENNFKKTVIDDFIDTYNNGMTPIPCIQCNQNIKFKDLLTFAQKLGATALATGHYVRKIKNNNLLELHKAVDNKKDQSYFLFNITQKQLEYLEFPLGNITKEQTRNLALKYGLSVADKAESQDICFIPGGNYRELLYKVQKNTVNKGKILHIDGYELGQHNGIANYTIGQRRGISIAFPYPLYVIKIDSKLNRIYVGPESALLKNSFLINKINLIKKLPSKTEIKVSVKIRHNTEEMPALISVESDDEIKVTLYNKAKAITPGQACVIYQGTEILGGGWITKKIG
ncbi:tRNA 2-thiouridine(34) synthase MnmA [Rickettsia endosymbiont of Cardiosporidium cionae]|uniref:tRNA 2-thiouridine(34) synthase MnmA n=1 Tax=Rickettsia endosymbiont of Cardiosporidium cionae TaxID=2777155 RepID=UPI001893CB1B|nr:tRNA 2-thiouridine(34) synthase MnmA [Rickettsia endosymbiont of Cardiosporidium cionae]KAF8818866.1 tRNA 2-thiouridine(34) synthase MnmA [Rickettsia endosymbiont of Cardiosporidium cionae]